MNLSECVRESEMAEKYMKIEMEGERGDSERVTKRRTE